MKEEIMNVVRVVERYSSEKVRDFVKNVLKLEDMKYRESVENSLLVYPTIYGTRLDVDNHLFAINGNVYT